LSKSLELKEAKMVEESKIANILPLASDIVAAHLTNNKVPSGELSELIRNVVQALADVGGGQSAPVSRPEPAVQIKKSVTPDYIVCLEDGKKLKMLKRHLRTAYNMSPDEYRARWQLPASYPMVAPNYAKTRSKLAKQIGLGSRPRGKRAQALSRNRPTRAKRGGRK
jgi:predicted transcriptional regulator